MKFLGKGKWNAWAPPAPAQLLPEQNRTIHLQMGLKLQAELQFVQNLNSDLFSEVGQLWGSYTVAGGGRGQNGDTNLHEDQSSTGYVGYETIVPRWCTPKPGSKLRFIINRASERKCLQEQWVVLCHNDSRIYSWLINTGKKSSPLIVIKVM